MRWGKTNKKIIIVKNGSTNNFQNILGLRRLYLPCFTERDKNKCLELLLFVQFPGKLFYSLLAKKEENNRPDY